MNFKQAIEKAAKLASADNKKRIVASRDMADFRIFDGEDAQAKSFENWLYVLPGGASAADFMEMFERAGIEADQDWTAEKTAWTLPCGTTVTIAGPCVELK